MWQKPNTDTLKVDTIMQKENESTLLKKVFKRLIPVAQILSLVITILLTALLVQIGLVATGLWTPNSNADIVVGIGSIVTGSLLGVILAVYFYKVRIYHEKDGFRKYALKGVSAAIALWVLLQILSVIFTLVFSQPNASSETSIQLGRIFGNTAGFLIVAILSAVLAPISEELLYRGVLARLISDHDLLDPETPRKEVILVGVIQAALFGVAHFQGLSSFTDYLTIIWTGASGFIFYLLYVKSRNIYVPILTHSTYNLITFLAMYLATTGV